MTEHSPVPPALGRRLALQALAAGLACFPAALARAEAADPTFAAIERRRAAMSAAIAAKEACLRCQAELRAAYGSTGPRLLVGYVDEAGGRLPIYVVSDSDAAFRAAWHPALQRRWEREKQRFEALCARLGLKDAEQRLSAARAEDERATEALLSLTPTSDTGRKALLLYALEDAPEGKEMDGEFLRDVLAALARSWGAAVTPLPTDRTVLS